MCKNTGDISSNTECQKWAQIERLGFWDPGPYPKYKSIIETITNILFNLTRTPIPNFKLLFEIKIVIGVILILKLLIVFQTMSGFPFSKIVLLVLELISPEIENQTLYFISICFVLKHVLDFMFCMFFYIYVDNGDVINVTSTCFLNIYQDYG